MVKFRGKELSKEEFDILSEIQLRLGEIPTSSVPDPFANGFGLEIREGHLISLVLQGCELQHPQSMDSRLIEKICELSHLQILGLYQNFLKSIPECIGKLKTLEVLNLGYNLLTELPNNLGNLESLKDLDLSTNLLTTLPPTLEKLYSLESINLNANKFTATPDVLKKMKSQNSKLNVILRFSTQRRADFMEYSPFG